MRHLFATASAADETPALVSIGVDKCDRDGYDFAENKLSELAEADTDVKLLHLGGFFVVSSYPRKIEKGCKLFSAKENF